MKKIIIDARYLAKPGVGINTYLLGLISAVRNMDCHVTYIVDIEPKNFSLKEGETLKIIPARSRILWEQLLLPRWLSAQEFNVFISPANFGLPLFFRKKGRKFALVVHDYVPLKFPAIYFKLRPVYSVMFLLFVPVSIMRADLILTISLSTLRDTKRIFKSNSINTYVPMSYEKTGTKVNKIHQDSGYFVYNGGPDPRKNVDILLKGFKIYSDKFRDAKLVIIGNGYDKYKKLAHDINLNNVEYKGYVSIAERDKILSFANANIITSKWEGFGLPVIESFIVGTPVICSRNSAIEEIGGDAVVFIEKLDPQGVCDALTTFRNMQETEKSLLVQRGYKRLGYFETINPEKVIANSLINL